MSSTTITKTRSFGDVIDFSKILVMAASAAALAIAAYFVLRNVPRYFVWSEASYGAYYWPRAAFLFPHVLAGLVALVVGPFQFWARIRNGYPKVHRVGGRIYLVSVLIAAMASMVLAVISSRGLPYSGGFFTLSVVWLLTSGMALVSIRKRNFIQHKQWMVRSYVLTFAFVTARVIGYLMTNLGIGQGTDRAGLISWACWVVPLLLTELVIQGKQVFASGARQSA